MTEDLYDEAYELVDNQTPGGNVKHHFGGSYQPSLDELVSVMTEETYDTYKSKKRPTALDILFPQFVDLKGQDSQVRLPRGVDRVVLDENYDGEYEVYYSNPEGDQLDTVWKGSDANYALYVLDAQADNFQLGRVVLL